MKNLMSLAFAAVFVFACNNAPAQTGNVKSYGEAITADGAISTKEFVQKMKASDSLATKLEAEVITSCIKKGCWMDVKLPDGEVMKVKFKDYGFFVPTEGLEGKHAVLQGYATKEVTDVATLKHYAEDAGKSEEEIAKITEDEESLFFIADGVLITF
ncbi:MAG: DUF4920 domain-containing protein [Bacteroidota bacterium]|nr:DUF4920 domain-containing protein [Bacteroidota bacterium]